LQEEETTTEDVKFKKKDSHNGEIAAKRTGNRTAAELLNPLQRKSVEVRAVARTSQSEHRVCVLAVPEGGGKGERKKKGTIPQSV